MLATAKVLNLALRFFLELAVIGAAGYWGFTLRAAAWVRVLAGLGAPAALIVVWALFGAPRAPMKLTGAAHLVLDVAWFGSGVVLLLAAGRARWAFVLAVVYLVNLALLLIWDQG
jgi:hypothetical protein